MDERRTRPLGELVELRVSSVDKKSKPNEKPVRLCNYTDVYYNSAIRCNMSFMRATASEREVTKCKLLPGDVVITKDSEKYDDIGVPALVVDDIPDLVCGYHLAILRPNTACIDGRYLFYAISARNIQRKFHYLANGITRFGLRKADIGLVEVPLPSLEEQRAIANTLGIIDDKIYLNRCMNDTLEAIARTIFKDWFVDFGPTRAKVEGRTSYMAPEIWDIFPDALDDRGKPVGWRTYALSELVRHHRKTLSPSDHPQSIYEHYSIPAYDAEVEPAYDLGASIKSNKTVIPEGAILISKLNPEIERVWLPNPGGETPKVASTEFLTFTPRKPVSCSVLYCLFTSPRFRAEMIARVTGTSKSHQRVPPKSILACEVLTANQQLLSVFDGMAGPMMNLVFLNRRESRRLARTRDILLPKLLSGEIRLRDAENLAEDAL